VQEIVIAVDPEEVPPLSEAVALSYEMTVVARSGRPDDAGDSRITLKATRSGPRSVETIVGDKRQTLVFPGSGRSPVPVQ
jgi:hypothetical protein